ncbi:MAG: alpha amylase C-terminal domain-containing protein, partial [Anaerolineales bacterium]|nr:alpha amylase C-terminal domain-containing protein [Anaerolineales bacterium]
SATNGETVTDWWDNGGNQIAFGRGSKGYVAINYTGSALTRTFATSMAAGTYCDVTKGELNAFGTGCTGPTITVNGSGEIVGQTVAAMDAFAIHVNAKVAACTATTPTANFAIALTPASPQLSLGWTDFGGPYQVRSSTTDPYFDPLTGALLNNTTPMSNSYVHAVALGTAGTHHFYVVQANNCAGAADSARVGAFSFGLVPGQ